MLVLWVLFVSVFGLFQVVFPLQYQCTTATRDVIFHSQYLQLRVTPNAVQLVQIVQVQNPMYFVF